MSLSIRSHFHVPASIPVSCISLCSRIVNLLYITLTLWRRVVQEAMTFKLRFSKPKVQLLSEDLNPCRHPAESSPGPHTPFSQAVFEYYTPVTLRLGLGSGIFAIRFWSTIFGFSDAHTSYPCCISSQIIFRLFTLIICSVCSFLNSLAVPHFSCDGNECSTARTDRSISAERLPALHWIGEWVVPKVGMDGLEIRKIFCLCRESNSDWSVRARI
jgi:hypothetical protein